MTLLTFKPDIHFLMRKHFFRGVRLPGLGRSLYLVDNIKVRRNREYQRFILSFEISKSPYKNKRSQDRVQAVDLTTSNCVN